MERLPKGSVEEGAHSGRLEEKRSIWFIISSNWPDNRAHTNGGKDENLGGCAALLLLSPQYLDQGAAGQRACVDIHKNTNNLLDILIDQEFSNLRCQRIARGWRG